MVLYELDFVNVLTLNERRTLATLMKWRCSQVQGNCYLLRYHTLIAMNRVATRYAAEGSTLTQHTPFGRCKEEMAII